MRIAITGQDIAHVKKSAKIYRRNTVNGIGQQKSLDHIAFLLGYKDYFNLSNELASIPEEAELSVFLANIEPFLKSSFGTDSFAMESFVSVLKKLSAFKPKPQKLFIIQDEWGEYSRIHEKATGGDVVDKLSALGLPRYEWWVANPNLSDIHEPSVVVLSKVIPCIREFAEAGGWTVSDMHDPARRLLLAGRIRNEVFTHCQVSAYQAVNEFEISPFGLSAVIGELANSDGTSVIVWVLANRETHSFLEPVFETEEAAKEALAWIALRGGLRIGEAGFNGTVNIALNGLITFATLPVENQIKASVISGKIVDATEGASLRPSDTPHHVINAHGFKLIQYRDLDKLRLGADYLSFLNDIASLDPFKDSLGHYLHLPDSPEKMHGAIVGQTLSYLRQLHSQFKGLVNLSNTGWPLPEHVIGWLSKQLVPVDHKVSPDHYYDFPIADMVKHYPQLCKNFPMDLLDGWYSDYLHDTQGLRSYRSIDSDNMEFASYLVFGAVMQTAAKAPEHVEIGSALLKLILFSHKIDIGALKERCNYLLEWIEVFDEWRKDISEVADGLNQLQPDSGMISHGEKRTTMTDLYRIGRKFNSGLVPVQL